MFFWQGRERVIRMLLNAFMSVLLNWLPKETVCAFGVSICQHRTHSPRFQMKAEHLENSSGIVICASVSMISGKFNAANNNYS